MRDSLQIVEKPLETLCFFFPLRISLFVCLFSDLTKSDILRILLLSSFQKFLSFLTFRKHLLSTCCVSNDVLETERWQDELDLLSVLAGLLV